MKTVEFSDKLETAVGNATAVAVDDDNEDKHQDSDKLKLSPEMQAVMKSLRFIAWGLWFVPFIVPIVLIGEGTSATLIGVALSSRVAGSMVGGVLSGRIADTRSNIPSLAGWGPVVKALGYIALYIGFIFIVYPLIAGGMFLTGMAGGIIESSLLVVISDNNSFDKRSETFGHYYKNVGIGSFYGSTVGMVMFASMTWTGIPVYIYSGIGVYAVAAICGGYFMQRSVAVLVHGDHEKDSNSMENKEAGQSELREHNNSDTRNDDVDSDDHVQEISKESFALLLVFVCLESLVSSVLGPIILLWMATTMTASITTLSYAYAPAGLLAVMAAPLVGRIGDKFAPHWALSGAGVVGGLCTLLILFTTEWWQVAIILVPDLVITQGAGLVLTKFASSLSKDKRGSVFGAINLAEELGNFVGPLFGGILWDTVSRESPFAFSISVEFLLAIVYPIFFIYTGLGKSH